MGSRTNMKSAGPNVLRQRFLVLPESTDTRCKGLMDLETWSHWGARWGPYEAGSNPGPENWELLGEVAAGPGQVFKIRSCQVHPPYLSAHLLVLYRHHKLVVNVSFTVTLDFQKHSHFYLYSQDGGGFPSMYKKEECQGVSGARWARGLNPNHPGLGLSSFPVSQ